MQAINQITITNILLRNFKGIKSFELNPNTDLTFIYGANGTNKTTVANSFPWLLWGKDLQDRKDFEIKTLDENNNVLHNLEHEVTYTFDVNGDKLTIRRIYAEKWQRRRGTDKTELTGHETSLFWNEVPKTMTEYEILVKQTFGNEEVFKCLTNTGYFNSFFTQDQRRKILLSLAGNTNDDSAVLKLNDQFPELLDRVSGRTFTEYKAVIAKKKKKIKETIDGIPSRIDEVNRMMPEEPDYIELQKQIDGLFPELEKITGSITDKSKLLEQYYEKRSEWVRNCSELKSNIQQFELKASEQSQDESNKANRKIYELNSLIQRLTQANQSADNTVSQLKKDIESYEKTLTELTDQCEAEQNQKFDVDESSLVCRACNRPFDGAQKENKILYQRDNFNIQKVKRIESLTERIGDVRKSISLRQDKIKTETENILKTSEQIKANTDLVAQLKADPVNVTPVADILANNEAYQQAKKRLKTLENNPIVESDISTKELEQDKLRIERQINELEAKKKIKDTVAQLQQREQQLIKEQADLNQEMATLEKDEFLMEQFETQKSDLLQERVNKLFSSGMVQFKLFERQLNGGYKDICETLCNGVPFRAANTASQVHAGLEIINVIQQHYGVILPIFMDNAESVTSIPYSPAQIIRLFVSPSHKSLTVQ